MLKSMEIAAFLGVEAVTIRKYCKALEAHGYSVQKDANGHRQYDDKDATAFQELKALRERTGLPLDKCAEVIAARVKEASGSVAPTVIPQNQDAIIQIEERYKEQAEVINRLMEHNEQQAAELARVHSRMDEQNANLTAILREMQETRRMVAAAQSRKWWKFWDKGQSDGPDPEAAWKRKQNPEQFL